MERNLFLRMGRPLAAALAVVTLAGQVLELEQAADFPQVAMTLRESRVVSIQPGGSADRAGLRAGDRLLAVAGRDLTWAEDALALLKRLRAGEPTVLRVRRDADVLELAYTPLPPDRMVLLWRFALAGVGIGTLLVGVLVFLKKPRPLTLVFGSICYAIGYLVHPPFVPPAAGLLVVRKLILLAATLGLPPLLVHLFLRFPLRHPLLERHQRRIGWLYAPSLALLAFAVGTAWFVPPQLLEGHWSSVAVEIGATLLWVVGIAIAITLFVQSYRHARSWTSRQKIRVILWGTILGTLPVAVLLATHQISPQLQIPGDRLAVLSIILIPLSFGYAIVRHGVFDLTLLVRRSLAFTLLAALLVLVYFVVQTALRGLFPGVAEGSPLWSSFISLVAVALLLLPAYRGLQGLVENRDGSLHREKEDLLYEFGAALHGLLDRGALVRLISDSMAEALGANRIAFFELSAEGALVACYLSGTPPERVARWHLSPAMSRRIAHVPGPLDRGDLDTELPFGYLAPADQETLDALDTRLLVPLRAGEALNGFVLAGEPATGEAFSARGVRLAETIAAEGSLALQNSLLQQRAIEEEHLRHEVELARDLQERLLPAHLPQVESLELSGYSTPCEGVGGDYYDGFLTPRGDVLLAIGDVSGKGVPGAILMANVQGLVKVEGMREEEPGRIVERINRQLCEMEKPERFVTFCLARIDPRAGRLAYCNAGHTRPLLARADGGIEELSLGGFPLGIGADAVYEGGEVSLQAGDVLLLYTDGITERYRPDGEPFGLERLEALLRNGRRLSARALQDTILGEVREFSPSPLDDDTTLLVAKLL
jgi:sigma-B regulation protein RsbU (phosphoserine phosphatase)